MASLIHIAASALWRCRTLIPPPKSAPHPGPGAAKK